MSLDPIDYLPIIAAPFFGSFMAALAYRLPRGTGIMAGRSRCDGCLATLSIAELLPILSWLWQRGRCRHCGQAIAIDNLVLEILALGLALWAALVTEGWLFWATCGFGWCLAVCAAIDFRHMILPDLLTLPLLLAGLAAAGAFAPGNLASHVIGAIAGFAVFLAVEWIFRRLTGREGLGLGDAKLLAAIGAWVGWPGLPSVVLCAAVTAILVTVGARKFKITAGGGGPIAFGPYLALGAWLVWLYGPLEIIF